ncbi:CAP domain-containing protein [Streptomyces sp. NPDC092296]|uniref:CAP domain-containing protein n=1 Tax=Streptomyces sp. NPDC092296 TaxID=3366012 RepID=UPI003818EA71
MKKLGTLAAAAALACLAAAPAPARPALPDTTTKSFLDEALKEANAVRAKHHAPPLVLDKQLNTEAAARAQDISRWEALSGTGTSGPRPGTAENFYWGGSSTPAVRGAADAVASWAAEGKSYDFKHPGATAGTGRFTQLVWKATTRVGAARTSGKGAQWYETYVVFVFRSPGNVAGQYAQNVLPASG